MYQNWKTKFPLRKLSFACKLFIVTLELRPVLGHCFSETVGLVYHDSCYLETSFIFVPLPFLTSATAEALRSSEGDDPELAEAASVQTAADFEDACAEELAGFQPSSTVTGGPDGLKDVLMQSLAGGLSGL